MPPINQFLTALGIVSLLCFLQGCQENVTPRVNPSQTPLTEGRPAQSESPELANTPEGRSTRSTPHVSPYIRVKVVDVEIRLLDTVPVQVELVIRGTLPDQCTYRFYSVENRAGQTVRVSLAGIHPAERSCQQTAQNVEYVLLLGRDMPEAERGFSPGVYSLTVNNYQTSFSIK